MIPLFPLLLLIFSGWRVEVNAQQASPPPSNYGGPYISDPGKIPPEEIKRADQIHEQHCRAHPDACIAPYHVPPPVNRGYGPDVPPDPANTAPLVTDTCLPDPDHPKGPEICTTCRANPVHPDKPACIRYTNAPGVEVTIPQIPSNQAGAE
jgi:hypothetical protein